MRRFRPPTMRGATRHPGFTLVEVIVALTITAGAVSLTYATFRLALRAQERGMARIHMLQRTESALDMIARDVRCAINLGSDTDYIFESTDDSAGDASADTLGFVATVNNSRMSTSASYDLARIDYYLDFDPDTPEQGLVRRQLSFPLPEEEEDRDAMARTIEVLPMAESLSILLHDAASAEWVENWDEMQGMPTAVKLELVTIMAEEPTEEEEDGEEDDEEAEVPEPKILTLLVHIPASRYTPSEDQGGGGQDEGFEEGEEAPPDEQGPQEGPGGGGAPGGQEIPQLPGFPTGGFPPQGGGGGGGGR